MEITRMEGYRIGHTVPVYDISEGSIYCSHCGLTDLYPECENNLRWLLNSGEDFRTEWCGSKKEIISAQYERLEGKVTVYVCQSMDSLYDEDALIYDAAYDVFHREDELTDDSIDTIRDAAWELGIEDEVTLWDVLPDDATYEDCMDAVDTLWNRTEEVLKDQYEMLKEIVGEFAEFKEED